MAKNVHTSLLVNDLWGNVFQTSQTVPPWRSAVANRMDRFPLKKTLLSAVSMVVVAPVEVLAEERIVCLIRMHGREGGQKKVGYHP